ncbi:hypothetical protein BKA56DRAFT_606292, partial [Ilyonectria sp. MPI-CAGE-AT-0026]
MPQMDTWRLNDIFVRHQPVLQYTPPEAISDRLFTVAMSARDLRLPAQPPMPTNRVSSVPYHTVRRHTTGLGLL